MRNLLILVLSALSTALPLSAQSVEAGVFVGQQSYSDFKTGGIYAKPDNRTVTSLRFGYSLTDIGPAEFQLIAGYQPPTTTTVRDYLIGTPQPIAGSLKVSAWSLGGMFNFNTPIRFGVGAEWRTEFISGDVLEGAYFPYSVNDKTTYGRPWIRANVGYEFESSSLKPFVGIEASAPLARTSGTLGTSDSVLKGLAPKLQVGVYMSLHF